jgi:hypothetical protein
MKMGRLVTKLWWKEKWMESNSLATSAISQKIKVVEGMVGIARTFKMIFMRA